MLKKIKNSLAAKVFLCTAGILMVCSLIIYAIIMVALPQSYEFVAKGKVEEEFNILISNLDKQSYGEGVKIISDFCLQNNAYGELLSGDGVATTFGAMPHSSATTIASANFKFKDNDTVFLLSITADASQQAELTTAFFQLLPFVFIFIVAISLFTAFVFSRIMVKPIIEISSISKRMSELDMTWHCKVNRTDELGVLANSLNIMAQRLDTTLKELEQANQKLRADIALTKKLEKQRRDFFAAASHELKTPVTIIKGQLESMVLKVGDYKNYEKYLPQVLLAAEDMEYLVGEILSISKMETMGTDKSMVKISVKDMVDECVQSKKPLAEKKEIEMVVDIENDIEISAQPQLLYKAFSNIIGNAVQYSPQKSKVYITLAGNVLTVKNTGENLAEKDLSNMFIPFYRAEQSRNKATGGSGLGLYIVKTVLELHNFKYNLESSENSVVFTVKLNQN